ncbi:MAG: RHS domain-containing protein [Gammaproteobacteria bacterium]|nr:RHS domain-containing protein [Gammaproteobacteria bacterium]
MATTGDGETDKTAIQARRGGQHGERYLHRAAALELLGQCAEPARHRRQGRPDRGRASPTTPSASASPRPRATAAACMRITTLRREQRRPERSRGALQQRRPLSENEGPQRGKAKDQDQTQGKSANSAKGHPNPQPDGLHTHYDNKPVTERLHFHYDRRGNLIAEADATKCRSRVPQYLGHYRIAMTAVSLDKPVVIPGNAKRSRRQQLALYYIHNDHLGTPMKVTDREQRVVWSMERTPFGRSRPDHRRHPDADALPRPVRRSRERLQLQLLPGLRPERGAISSI